MKLILITNHKLSTRMTEPVTDVQTSLWQCLNMSNLYLIELLLDNNYIDFQTLDNTLSRYREVIKSQKIAEYLINYGLDRYSLATRTNFVELYIHNEWSTDMIIKLLDNGAKLFGSVQFIKSQTTADLLIQYGSLKIYVNVCVRIRLQYFYEAFIAGR